MIKYFVHYQGWAKTWDEWVPENRVLKFNESNLERQQDLKEQAEMVSKKKKKPLDSDQVSSPSSSGSSKTRSEGKEKTKKTIKVEPGVESEMEFIKRVEVKVKMPETLKTWLVDDWDLITRRKMLVNIPARITVEQVLSDYLTTKTSNSKFKESQLQDVMDGIREYFNAMLGPQLLYRFERQQYQKLDKTLNDDIAMSTQYGVIHLVRLFVKIGHFLALTDSDEKSIGLLNSYFDDFLKFIASKDLFSKDDYIPASQDYIRKINA